MALATVTLRDLMKTGFKLFDFDYTFDDPQEKAKLEQAVIDFYWFYEIGQETPDRFKHTFKERWRRKIGRYNALHNTTLLQYNPMVNYTMDEAMDELTNMDNTTTTNNSTDYNNTVNNDSNMNTKRSDYPQQPITPGGDFLAGATEEDNSSNTSTDGTTSDNGTTEGTGTTNTNYTKTIEGITGITYQELIQRERDVILSYTTDLINEMKPCFMLVW